MNSSRRIRFAVPVWVLVLSVILPMCCASSTTDLVPDQQVERIEEKPVQERNTDSKPNAAISLSSNVPDFQPSAAEISVGGKIGDLAPDFIGITNWINSEPLSIKDLRGKVVLVDVWTYTCVNCIRTFPYLKDWHAKYADDGLLIVGLHSPEFEFEKDTENVVQATTDYGILWPVAQDNDMQTWSAYENRFWPAKYLVDHDGLVRYTHFGEGSYGETEIMIRNILLEAGADLSDDIVGLRSDQAEDKTFNDFMEPAAIGGKITPELYTGYYRNYSAARFGSEPYVVQTEYYKERDTVVSFTVPDELLPHKVYFNGDWLVKSESARHGRVTENYEDYVAIKYSARSVNAVITSDSGEPYQIKITMDGKWLTDENKGADVTIAADGKSYILVTEPRLYAIVENPRYVQGKELRISSNSDDFVLFAYTFGVYEKGL